MRMSKKGIVFNGEFDVCVTVIEVVQKLSCVFTVKQGEGIVNVPKPNGRASVVVKMWI